VDFVDPLHHGDTLSLSGLSSGSDMDYGRVAYDALLNGEGTRVGVSYSALRYKLGDPLSALDAHGTAEVESLWARQPLVRSADANLYGQIQYDHLQLDDQHRRDRNQDGPELGQWHGESDRGCARMRGSRVASLRGLRALRRGRSALITPPRNLADAASVRTEGHYLKWNANFYRLQNVTRANTLYFAISGQWANANLDSSQKMLAGGPYTVACL